jgi:diadenosine tetraphosphate (Ap4A) HIT family hydrolase
MPSPAPEVAPACPLCSETGGILVHCAERWRVVRVPDADFPAFYRVIWTTHLAEFTDLSAAERAECMAVVTAVERVLREQLQPTKVNLASLGNLVPHLHWHVIARFDWDSHFPGPVWASAQRRVEPAAQIRLAVPVDRLDAVAHHALERLAPAPR